MVKTVYHAWVWSHGAASLTAQNIATQPSIHFAPMLLYNYYKIHLDDNGSTLTPKSHIFMQELLESLDPKALIRAAHNVLAYSSNFGDTSLVAFLRVFGLQMQIIGLQWYAHAPLLADFNIALARQPRVGSGTQSQLSLEAYGLVYEHIM